MDDWVFRRDLVDPAELKALSQRSDARGALQAASHFAAIGATAYGIHATWGTLWCVPVFILHGTLLNYLYAAQHELIHRTAFKTRWVNDGVAYLTGFLQLYPCDLDRIRHFQHHRYTKDPERASDTNNRTPITLARYVTRLLCIQYWTGRVKSLALNAWGEADEFYFTAADKRAVILEARWYIAGYVAIAALSLWFETWFAVWGWLAPLLLTKGFHQFHNITEHSGLPNVKNVPENTRTVATNPLMAWMVWNMCYHADHHLFPGVPFHQLAKLHALTGQHLRVTAPGYLAFHGGLTRRLWREWRQGKAATKAASKAEA